MPVSARGLVNKSCKREKAPVIGWMTEARTIHSEKDYNSISSDPLECKGGLV